MKALARTGLLVVYSLFFGALLKLLKPLAGRHRRLSAQLTDRPEIADLAKAVVFGRNAKRHGVLFYCSSGGEYEQAKPLMDRLEKRGDTYVAVMFFSRSGLDFAKARGETATILLAPVTDSIFAWGSFMTAFRPSIVAVVRYELWPGFLDAARSFGTLHLLDASKSFGERSSRLKRWARGEMLSWFEKIHAVSDGDSQFFRATYHLPAEKILVSGDTKYDRARERAEARAADTAQMAARLTQLRPQHRRIIFGSVHMPDVEALLAAIQTFPQWHQQWLAIIAPHHVDTENLNAIAARCREKGLILARWSGVEKGRDLPAGAHGILLDSMGRLAEVYGAADAAFVGGSLHYRVHNVLEPAVRGLALAYGPFYKNSQEAVYLAESKLAAVVADGVALGEWWRGLGTGEGPRAALTAAVSGMIGASDRILATWKEALG